MTALKPIEYRDVVGVSSSRYPLNTKCAHPECAEPTHDPHHIFPRSAITNDSWFVQIRWENGNNSKPIPHVVGLCRQHHEDVEAHRAWIKYEDGEFVWYDRVGEEVEAVRFGVSESVEQGGLWEPLGPLDPQPATGEKRRKRRPKLKGQERRKKTNLTVKVPQDELEDGAGLFYDAVEQLEQILGYDPPRSIYYTLMDALNLAILHGEADA